MLRATLESSLSIVSRCVSVYAAADDFLQEVLLLLRDVAEVQLPELPLQSSRALYAATGDVLTAVAGRLKEIQATPKASEEAVQASR